VPYKRPPAKLKIGILVFLLTRNALSNEIQLYKAHKL
jgi:hypothetical protein